MDGHGYSHVGGGEWVGPMQSTIEVPVRSKEMEKKVENCKQNLGEMVYSGVHHYYFGASARKASRVPAAGLAN